MSVQSATRPSPRSYLLRLVPVAVVILAALTARSSLASSHPKLALCALLWILSDTLLLALIARSPERRPCLRAVIGTSATACCSTWLVAPPLLRQALLDMPILVAALAIPPFFHLAGCVWRARSRLTASGLIGERLIAAVSELLPPALVRLAIAELTVIHMALFRWGGPADVPQNSRAFSYHRHLTPICATLLCLSVIEVAVYHLLVGHWSRTASIVLFVLSDVGLVYLLGLIKSFRFRPILITPEGIRVRSGFLIDRLLPWDAIAAIETGFPGEAVRDADTLNAALLAWPNVLIRLHAPLPRRSLRKGEAWAVAFRLDDPEPFLRLAKWRIGLREGYFVPS